MTDSNTTGVVGSTDVVNETDLGVVNLGTTGLNDVDLGGSDLGTTDFRAADLGPSDLGSTTDDLNSNKYAYDNLGVDNGSDPLAELEKLTDSYIEMIAPENDGQINQGYETIDNRNSHFSTDSVPPILNQSSSAWDSPDVWDNTNNYAQQNIETTASSVQQNVVIEPPKIESKPNVPEKSPVGQVVILEAAYE